MRKFLLLIGILMVVGCSLTNNFNQSIVKFDNHGELSLTYDENSEGYNFVLETSDPVALRTLLMQGFKLHVLSNVSDTTTVSFPSAKDVSNDMEHHPGEVKATIQNKREKRPDIRPLLAALNKANVSIKHKGGTTSLDSGYNVSVSPSNGVLSYELIVPTQYVNGYISKIILVSKPDTSMIAVDEFTGQGYANRSDILRQQPLGVDKEHPQKTLNIEFNFSK